MCQSWLRPNSEPSSGESRGAAEAAVGTSRQCRMHSADRPTPVASRGLCLLAVIFIKHLRVGVSYDDIV
jgi:hypothetical protein